MPNTLEVTLGQDLSAYAVVLIAATEELPPDELVQLARRALDDSDVEFDEDWSTCEALRVVSVRRGANTLMSDIPVETQYAELGRQAESFLRGRMGLGQLVSDAIGLKALEATTEVALSCTVHVPSAPPCEVRFAVRKGATEAERALAFLKALSAVATARFSEAP